MEGRKKTGSSSSSFTSELFGSKESSASSGIFGAIFAPSSKDLVFGRESLRSEVTGKKLTDDPLHFKPRDQPVSDSDGYRVVAAADGASKEIEGESKSITNMDIISSIYRDQRVQQPCHFSSSIYYGGQDIYAHPQSTQNPEYNTPYKKDGTEDDSGSASRGNWWQGISHTAIVYWRNLYVLF
ncbi:hypothetical protein C1H46_036847 [Malus baccata]|uniref:Uncharacterized protein n=1 Tax=Malus baccata TaxID=106549 RepID=A0A540KTV3_MALBA|nr:hypothetical protein C1H46_036846 [Malus baccata]TQD77638.1 hypothetical protein C1H46_036847 [Malus baccata]